MDKIFFGGGGGEATWIQPTTWIANTLGVFFLFFYFGGEGQGYTNQLILLLKNKIIETNYYIKILKPFVMGSKALPYRWYWLYNKS